MLRISLVVGIADATRCSAPTNHDCHQLFAVSAMMALTGGCATAFRKRPSVAWEPLRGSRKVP